MRKLKNLAALLLTGAMTGAFFYILALRIIGEI
jgi:hypothetical protein